MNREYELEKALDGLVDIVERVGCIDWRNGQGLRLKDTPQWVKAYVALHKNHAQPAAPVAQVPEGYVLMPEVMTDEMFNAMSYAIADDEPTLAIYEKLLAAAQSAKGGA